MQDDAEARHRLRGGGPRCLDEGFERACRACKRETLGLRRLKSQTELPSYSMATSSTSNSKVAPGGITPPAPRWP
jgi:hypothetical protein